MKEILKGIYSLDGNPPNLEKYSKENQGLAVAMHPFYRQDKKGKRVFIDSKIDYFNRINEFLFTYSGPILTLEAYNSLDETEKHFLSLNHSTDRFFMRTNSASSFLRDLNFSDMTNFIESLRVEKPVSVLGGYIFKGLFGDSAGCLAGLIHELEKADIPFKKINSLIYSSPLNDEKKFLILPPPDLI